MNLVVITALIAVCGAAKLDRTYLPPASAKTAGGSPGSLQTPFSRNSFNNGLGGLPKGSYENDFQGVVVDAAAAGTRASEPGDSGLGAPRISYGSTDSKVGAAAFKTKPSAFSPVQSDEQTEQGFEAQGSFPSAAATSNFQQGPSFSNAGAPNAAFQQQSSNSDRPRASLDRSASILRYENEVGPESYHYAFETDNGISAEENGVATNGVQAQGGFSYTGDDGQVYSVSYTADERGYQPKGDHLPTPPPIPEEILKSLEQNARDEAAGLSDDGSYDAQRYNAGSDYAESGDANGKFTHQSSKFGGAETDAATFNQNQGSRRPVVGQSSFNSQTGQGSNLIGQNANRYTQGNFASGSNGASNGQGLNAQSGLTSTATSGQFEQSELELADDDSTSGQFGQATTGVQTQTNGFGSFSGTSSQSGSKQSLSRPGLGNRNEYLPPTNRPNGRPQSSRQQSGRPQNGRPQAGRPQGQDLQDSTDASQDVQEHSDDETPVPLGEQDLQGESRPQQALTSFGKPISNGLTSQNGFGSSNNQVRPSNGRRPLSNSNNFAQGQSSQTGKPNEYLPPTVSSPNRRPTNRPQSTNNFASQFTLQNQESSENSEDVQSQDQTQDFPASSITGSQSTFGSLPNRLQKPQPSRQGQNNNRFSSQSQTALNSASAQPSFGFNSPKATAQPATELTTPFETSSNDSPSQISSQTTTDDFNLPTQQSNGVPAPVSYANQQNKGQNGFGSQSVSRPQTSRPQNPRPFGQSQASAFPTQSSTGQFNQYGQLVNQPQSQSSFGQNEDTQYSSSTPRPNFTGQPQGADDSYYYNQPSKPFGVSQGSRFPSAPSNQFNSVTQQSSYDRNQFANSAQNVPSTAFPSSQFQASTKYPRPPVVRPTASSSQIQGQFGNDYRKPLGGSTRQPRPPILAPASPTVPAQSQYQGNNVNGVTQASISPFPSQTPTQASQGQFGSRPTFQQSQYNQGSQSFAQQPTQPSFNQQSTASASFSQRPSTSFQNQAQTFGQQVESQGNEENEQPLSSQQYTGEIYEYSKPAVTLPPPDSTPASPSPQFGNKMPGQGQFGKPQAQFGQTSEDEEQMTVAQFGNQSPSQGSRPQFGTQSKPQFGQNFGAQAQQNEQDMKPFGALAQSQAMFGSQASKPSRPQFGQSRPQFGQTQSTFGQSESTQELQDETPQFGAQPQTESEAGTDEPQSPQGPKNQFGFVSACCRDNASRKPAKNQLGVQSQFGQSSFGGAQKQPTNSLAGQGEEFGGPRQPPSFDDETGYHY